MKKFFTFSKPKFIYIIFCILFIAPSFLAGNGAIYNYIIEKFPHARILKIEQERNVIEINFLYNNQEYAIEYDVNGNVLFIEKTIPYSELPDTIRDHLQIHYNDWDIDEIEIIESPDKQKYYEIELKKGYNGIHLIL
ncbi:MAG: PepSY-like domain-containing protein [Spirochaetales bacterium]|nr:PepSY-like domain-containing protein [Spirochaetales bacterium]